MAYLMHPEEYTVSAQILVNCLVQIIVSSDSNILICEEFTKEVRIYFLEQSRAFI